MRSLSYSAQLVRAHDRGRFLLCLFVPEQAREVMFTLYALDAELARVPMMVSEEALGHIRYAWWLESLEAAAAGKLTRGHPLLEALPPQAAKRLLKLAESYREHYPDPPSDHRQKLDALALEALCEICPQAEPGWLRAKSLIDRHRERYGPKWNGWLSLKLLWIGI